MKTFSVFTDKIRSTNNRFWAACGADELYAVAQSPQGEYLMQRMKEKKSCFYARNHYTLSKEILYNDIRCGGDVYSEDAHGNPIYDFSWINNVYRLIVNKGIKPIVELDFLPPSLTGENGHITQEGTDQELTNHFYPNDWNKWSNLLKAFVQNLANEFGLEEIRTWYFEVWNEPDNWKIESWDMFFKMYDVFVDAVTSVDPHLRVGGPGCFRQHFMYAFLNHIVNGTNHVTGKKGSRIDFISYHIYGMSGGWLNEYPLIMPSVQRFSQELAWIKRMIDFYPSLTGIEFMLNEWGVVSNYERSVSEYPVLELRNSEYSALFFTKLADTIIEHKSRYHFNITQLLYWGYANEDFFGVTFNGNRSLTTNYNICKPIQTVMELFSLFDENFVETNSIPGADEGIIAASGSNGIQALIYYFDEYDAERKLPSRNYQLNFCGLSDGIYKLKVYTIDDTHNNTYRLWQRLGSKQILNETEQSLLHSEQELSFDKEIEIKVINGNFNYSLSLSSISLKFITLQKI
jgi:xylan 1,4-beta-xylosidase